MKDNTHAKTGLVPVFFLSLTAAGEIESAERGDA